MNFKSSEQLIARVNEQLHSYQSSGMLDEGEYYRWIKEVLGKLNTPAFSTVHTIIDVEDGMVPIPEDLYQIWAIYRYAEKTEYTPTTKNLQNQIAIRSVEAEIDGKCVDPCEIEKFTPELLIAKVYVNTVPHQVTYTGGQLLTLKNFKVEKCNRESPSIHNKSSLEVTMDNDNFYFNFETGSVYLQYHRLMVDEDGIPMVPDVIQIEQAIESFIIYKIFQKLYFNGTMDALQRMEYSEQKWNEHYRTAVSWVKLASAKSLIAYSKLIRNKYKRFEN